MTILEKMSKRLYDHGLFEDQCKQIIEEYLASDLGKEMRGRINEDEAVYPPQLIAIVWIGIKKAALIWMAKKCPKHWARQLFVD